MQLEAGTVFADRFRIVRLLSEGGFGTVYVAEQLQTGRERALKVLHPHHGEDPNVRAKFAQEAKIGASIASDHVVEVLDAGFDPVTGSPWLAMELLEGETLEALVQRRGALPRDEALSILRQVAHALAAAHSVGVVHRDLKAENVFVARRRSLTATTSVKVLDFGIARWLQESKTATAASQAIGTPMWMAPEQAEHGGRISPATDIWALGLLAFYLLTGRMFWLAASEAKPSISVLLAELIAKPIPPATQRAAELGVDPEAVRPFEGWLARCLDRDPHRRPRDAAEAIAQLEAEPGRAVDPYSATAAVTPPTQAMAAPAPTAPMPMAEEPVRLPTRSRLPLLLGGSAAAALVVAGVVVVLIASKPDDPDTPAPEPVDEPPVVQVDPSPPPAAPDPSPRPEIEEEAPEPSQREAPPRWEWGGDDSDSRSSGELPDAVREQVDRQVEARRASSRRQPESESDRMHRALDVYAPRVETCFTRYGLSGFLLVNLHVEPDGSVSRARRASSNVQGAPGGPGIDELWACAEPMLRRARLPPHDHAASMVWRRFEVDR